MRNGSRACRMLGAKSLQVAIEDGDVGILADWLELIAHEPQSYQLQEILRDGVLAATERAYDDGALGIRLMLIAARRVPELVDVLSADQRLMAALESQLQEAALESLIEERAEYFLLALYHGVKVAEGQPVTAAVAKRLLALQKSTEAIPLPANYHPGALIQLLATQAQPSGDGRSPRFIVTTYHQRRRAPGDRGGDGTAGKP